jgi:GT2 family glycosyltransferase
VSLAVIIPSRTASNLLPCLEAVHLHEPSARLLVVDDGVDWDAFTEALRSRLDLLEPLWRKLEVLSAPKPFCFARNCNFGINTAGADDVVLLNDDAALRTPGGFTAMQREAEKHPEYGVISAACNNVGNRNQWPQQGGQLRDEPRMVCFVAVLIPRRTIEAAGLLDERYVGYGLDDDDYCLRVRGAGLKIGIFDGCYVDHSSLVSTFRGAAGAGGDYRSNLDLFVKKWGVDNWGKLA